VQTHRDPLRIIASLASLVARLRSLAGDDTCLVVASGPREARALARELSREIL
jgi:arginine repressor